MKKIVWALMLTGLAQIVGCATTERPFRPGSPEAPVRSEPVARSEPVVVDSSTVILDETQALLLGSFVGGESAWMPTKEDIAAAERLLRPFLAGSNDMVRRIGARLDRYGRQWVGVVVGGKRQLYGNFFWLDDQRQFDWQRKALCARDGGAHFFQVLFDVDGSEFTRLSVNGDA
jgi:hypothetical protein